MAAANSVRAMNTLEHGSARNLVGNISALARRCGHKRTRTLMRRQAWQIVRGNETLKLEKVGINHIRSLDHSRWPELSSRVRNGDELRVDRSGEGSHGILVEGLTEHKNSISPETSRFLRGVSDADLVEALLLVRMSREAENDHFETIGCTAQAAKRDRPKVAAPTPADELEEEKRDN
mmetsp:Transcript_25294/g.99891  ORF Transcript_25294/g.99891 Transcript_25294/m.99891 type:complete len:178 (+) Transcript_25294:355-888(+)